MTQTTGPVIVSRDGDEPPRPRRTRAKIVPSGPVVGPWNDDAMSAARSAAKKKSRSGAKSASAAESAPLLEAVPAAASDPEPAPAGVAGSDGPGVADSAATGAVATEAAADAGAAEAAAADAAAAAAEAAAADAAADAAAAATARANAWAAPMNALGGFIRAQRQLAKLSLRDMATMTSVSNAYLSQVERGLHQPSLKVLHSIADALQLSTEQLLSQAGWATGSGEQSGTANGGTEEAIRTDPRLTPEQRTALLGVYRSFVDGSA